MTAVYLALLVLVAAPVLAYDKIHVRDIKSMRFESGYPTVGMREGVGASCSACFARC
eukprot:m.78125 g.78125  ORF g.78125 m.78125 type:complete len:57 (+) comp50538_c0_seq2:83-253(+)